MFNDILKQLNTYAYSYKPNPTDIKTIYDVFKENTIMRRLIEYANKTNLNWINRLKDPNRKTIPAWEDPKNSVATHKLSYANDEFFDYIFPNVQEINGELIDFTDQKNKNLGDSLDSALKNNEVLKVPRGFGDLFTKNYKDYYPTFKKD